MSRIIFLLCLAGVCSCCFAQWKLVEPLPDGFLSIHGIQFVNNDTGYVCSYTGIGKTVDAGETWSFNTEHTGDFLQVQFINADTGIIQVKCEWN